MNTNIATVAATDNTPAVIAAPSNPLTWATKAGTIKAAHTAAAIARAPAAVRTGEADAKTVAQLLNGQYRPFLSDVLGACSKGHLIALEYAVRAALTTTVDGVPMVPSGNVLAVVNRKAVAGFVAWLANPTAVIKGVEQSKPLPKGKQYLCAIAQEWAAQQAEAALAAAMIGAGMNDSEATEAPQDDSEALQLALAMAEGVAIQ